MFQTILSLYLVLRSLSLNSCVSETTFLTKANKYFSGITIDTILDMNQTKIN